MILAALSLGETCGLLKKCTHKGMSIRFRWSHIFSCYTPETCCETVIQSVEMLYAITTKIKTWCDYSRLILSPQQFLIFSIHGLLFFAFRSLLAKEKWCGCDREESSKNDVGRAQGLCFSFRWYCHGNTLYLELSIKEEKKKVGHTSPFRKVLLPLPFFPF